MYGSFRTRLASHLREPLFRNGYALMANAALSSAVGFLYWVVAARMYPVDVVGTNAAAIAAINLLRSLAGFCLDSALVRFVPRAGRKAARLIALVYLITAAATALAVAIFLLGLNLWSPGLRLLTRSPLVVVGFVFACMVGAVFNEEDAALTGLRQAVWIPIENTIHAFLNLGLLLVFARLLPDYGILASTALPALFLVGPVNYLIFRCIIPGQENNAGGAAPPFVPKEVVRYAAGNYVGTLFVLAWMVLPPVIVLQLGGSAASAYFYVPWAVGTLLQLFANNMGTSMVAEGSFDQSKRLENLRLALIETARLLIPAVAVLCIGAPYFLRLLGAEYASNGVLLLRFVALAALPGIVVNLEIAFLRVTNRVGGVIAIDVALAVGTLGLSYAWLPRLGIAGVGLAMLASQTSVAVLLLLTELRVILSPGVPAGGAAPPGGTAL